MKKKREKRCVKNERDTLILGIIWKVFLVPRRRNEMSPKRTGIRDALTNRSLQHVISYARPFWRPARYGWDIITIGLLLWVVVLCPFPFSLGWPCLPNRGSNFTHMRIGPVEVPPESKCDRRLWLSWPAQHFYVYSREMRVYKRKIQVERGSYKDYFFKNDKSNAYYIINAGHVFTLSAAEPKKVSN